MLAAGLLAKKAVEKGLKVPPYVKTSLAPGSRVVTDYLDKAGLTKYLDKLGFHTVGYGCTTCIGNSGPLPEPIANAVKKNDLVVAGVLSRQPQLRRPHQPAREGQLPRQPAAGRRLRARRHDRHRPRRTSRSAPARTASRCSSRTSGRRTPKCRRSSTQCVLPEMFRSSTTTSGTRTPSGTRSKSTEGELFDWDADEHLHPGAAVPRRPARPSPARSSRSRRPACLAALGDSVTTDHISPAGSIAKDSPAGKYLIEHGVQPVDFNSYGARRGNDRVMTRGTFANIRIRNLLAPGTEGGVTRHLPDGEVMTIYDAAMKYKAEGVPLVVLAGKEYGTGSQPRLGRQGHVPARRAGRDRRQLRAHPPQQPGRHGRPAAGVRPGRHLAIARPHRRRNLRHPRPRRQPAAAADDDGRRHVARRQDAKSSRRTVRIDTPVELDYYRNGGILHTVTRKLLKT